MSSKFTESQLKRVERLVKLFSPYDGMSVEHRVDVLKRCDPEEELRFWEHMAEGYVAELPFRPNANEREKKNLYYVLLNASLLGVEHCTADNVVTLYPAAKSLPRLAEAVERYRAKLAAQSQPSH